MILKSTVLLNNGDFKVFIFEENSYLIMSVHIIMYTAGHAVPPGKYDFFVREKQKINKETSEFI